MTTEEKIQGGVQSLEVGLSVLDVFIRHQQPLMLKNLAEALNMHPAKVHRYVVSLVRMGYAKQLEDGRYGLGDQAWKLGLSCIQRTDAIQIAQPFILQVQRQLNCGFQLSKWTPQGPLIVQWLEANHAVTVITRVGSIMPLLNSATGRLWASYQPESLIRPMLEQEWAEHAAQGVEVFPENWERFLALKHDVLQRGYATVSGDMMVGINALCVPILNVHGEVEFSVACLGTAKELAIDEPHNNKVQALIDMAKQLSQLLSQAVQM